MKNLELIDEILLSNTNKSEGQMEKIKTELVVITRKQIEEIMIIAQVAAIDKKTIQDTLLNFRSHYISNTCLAEELQDKLINNIKK